MKFANQLNVSIKTDEDFIRKKNKVGKDLEVNVTFADHESQSAFWLSI